MERTLVRRGGSRIGQEEPSDCGAQLPTVQHTAQERAQPWEDSSIRWEAGALTGYQCSAQPLAGAALGRLWPWLQSWGRRWRDLTAFFSYTPYRWKASPFLKGHEFILLFFTVSILLDHVHLPRPFTTPATLQIPSIPSTTDEKSKK